MLKIKSASEADLIDLLPVWEELNQEFIKVKNKLAEDNKKLREKQAHDRLQFLLQETEYQDPEYPDMGIAGTDGYCLFTSEAQAVELTQALKHQSYYYAHDLKYSGPGKYKIEPSWDRDHDNEIIYTATYIKGEEL